MEFKDLVKQYKSIKQDPVREKESYDLLLDHFRQTFATKPKISFNLYLSLRPVAVSLLAFIFVFVSGFGVLMAAKNTLPGNFLYPVKRVAEKGRMALVFNQSHKTVLRAEILTNRLSEARILAERVEKGDKNLELELNTLAQDFTNELKVLKKEVAEQVAPKESVEVRLQQTDAGPVEPFPEQELLAIDQLPDQGSLPVQDQRQVFTVMPTEDLARLLSETRELLAEENLDLALVRIMEAEKLVQEQEPKVEEDISPEPEEETLPEQPEVEVAPQREQEPVINDQQSTIDNQPASVGQILLKEEVEEDFKVRIEKDSPAKTGMIREK